MKAFGFSLGEAVGLSASNEHGVVIARAEYVNRCPAYLVRYRAADGSMVEAWWDEDALVSLEETRSAA
ncbi:hypothetical protein [Ancylobacter mangrovi]|uniref:hypothetical protein n=1 Tax=Ancylobacter mangrovi TaxID=2972472 RepID=UPI00216279DD|nr:hypothetical protein [Ancylobacter mangrovi]MCS0501419.1 hypothetical protein [Ancylobacter mangrovi]